VIRTEEQFVWNFTGMMAFLAAGLLLGMVFLFAPQGGLLAAFGGVFTHLGVGHILGNIMMIMLMGLGLSVFAHPVEFAGILLSATVVHTVMSYFFFPVVGLSLVLYAMVASLIVYLFAVMLELDNFGIIGKVALPMTGILLLAVVLFLVSDQLLHDLAVVFDGQAVQIDDPIYTRKSSLAHVIGFFWGLVAAVGLRFTRYKILNIP